jgi:eukaryotic-like serine/threonine-protein kinase
MCSEISLQNNNRLFLFREVMLSLVFTSLLLSSFLLVPLSLGHVYSQTEIWSISSRNYNTFSLYKNTPYNFDMQYPSNWQKIEFTQGIERGGRTTVVNFLSPSEGTADKFREYFIVKVDDLRSEQGFATSSPPSFSKLSEYVNHQISDYKGLYQGFQLTQSPTSSLLNKTDNASKSINNSLSYKTVYTYDDTIAGKIQIMELYLLKNNKIYLLSFHAEASNYSKYLPAIQKIVDSVHIS